MQEILEKEEIIQDQQTETKVPTVAKAIKDIDAILKETRVKLVVTIAEYGSPYTREVEAIVQDIEYLKRVKEALK